MKYACPCCGYYTYEHIPDGSYDICPVCFWEDDIVQLEDPLFEEGANNVSLQQARLNYKEFGTCEKEMLQYVRKPNLGDEFVDEFYMAKLL